MNKQRKPEDSSASDMADVGLVLMDLSFRPVAFDRGAIAILTDAAPSSGVPTGDLRLPREVVEAIRRTKADELPFTDLHFQFGHSEYSCRAFLIESQDGPLIPPILALHLIRDSSPNDAVDKVALEYHLTERERETLRGISMGLTSKQMAHKMSISPNTVKAFLRLIMIKMGVTRRAEIVTRLLDHGNNHVATARPSD